MGGNFRMFKNPPSKEIKVKMCLSGIIPLKYLTVQLRTKTGRVDKMT